jgi:hypothetical protein
MSTYSVDFLLAEAEAQGLAVQFFENRCWQQCHELQWICWLRQRKNWDMACKGEGSTAGEAINAAMNTALSHDPPPEIKISGYSLSLDSLCKGLPKSQPSKVTVAPGAIRRF